MSNNAYILLSLALLVSGLAGAAEPESRSATCGPKSACADVQVVPSTACAACGATGVRAWYIGPKGGDIRRNGQALGAPLAEQTGPGATDRSWRGPKGGDTRKGFR
jgi:hypothetical protein